MWDNHVQQHFRTETVVHSMLCMELIKESKHFEIKYYLLFEKDEKMERHNGVQLCWDLLGLVDHSQQFVS